MTTLPVEALLPGDLVHLEDQVVRVTSPAWGVPGTSRAIGAPRVTVHVYGRETSSDDPRHLDWPAGTTVQVVRP